MNFEIRSIRILVILITAITLTACGSPSPESLTPIPLEVTSIPQTTGQSISTATNKEEPSKTLRLPNTATVTITPEIQNMGTVELPLPSGKPAVVWNGVPIMPNAISGEETDDGYSYTIQDSPEEVKTYYESEMVKIGWTAFAIGKGETGSLLLMYQKEGKTTTVSVFEQENLTLILLFQF